MTTTDTAVYPSEPEAAATGPLIVVGVSVATGSKAALTWAVEEAAARHGRVRAVMAWRPSGLPGGAPGRPPAQAIVTIDQQQVAEEQLNEFVADALGENHGVECVSVEGRPRAVLLQESQHAALLVVDSPRLAKLTSRGARRLAPRLIFSASCPVVVMPPPPHEAAADERGLDRDESQGVPIKG